MGEVLRLPSRYGLVELAAESFPAFARYAPFRECRHMELEAEAAARAAGCLPACLTGSLKPVCWAHL